MLVSLCSMQEVLCQQQQGCNLAGSSRAILTPVPVLRVVSLSGVKPQVSMLRRVSVCLCSSFVQSVCCGSLSGRW